MNIDELNYALNKALPDMARGFLICTAYGEFSITADDAEAFMRLAKKSLTRKKRAVERNIPKDAR